MFHDRRQRKPSALVFAGGLLASIAVGLSAYAAHGAFAELARSHLQSAALFAFGHGIALAALASGTTRRMGRGGLLLLLLGTLLFSGSLAFNAFFQIGTRLAPVGGICLMLGWLLWAVDALRR
ncbi:hypothetical protein CSC70_11190 [Pseudoxanthomonas kalamensis DSM 18571]|uniref:DUF423 domain-containing protein n=1 Tax=Pseudoxanthomonas kalamensis TaxID=289483 RepID=UPI0013907316|nr:DUF423 domain-containing protein [Pseudoxanthomonas kalamensis]KAF1709477.1 hypothetical protein CSC70_11190 [Pseudoxanthomonas kalamensis DSM 18571]